MHIRYPHSSTRKEAWTHCPWKPISLKIRIQNATRPQPPPCTPDDHILCHASYSEYCTQELNTGIVDEAKYEEWEEEPAAGQTNSRGTAGSKLAFVCQVCVGQEGSRGENREEQRRVKASPTWGSAWRAGARQRARAGPRGRQAVRRMRGQPGRAVQYRGARPRPAKGPRPPQGHRRRSGAGSSHQARGPPPRGRKAASAPGPRSVRTTEAGRGPPGPSRDSGPRQRAGRAFATPGLVRPPRPGTGGRGRAALPSLPRPAAATYPAPPPGAAPAGRTRLPR